MNAVCVYVSAAQLVLQNDDTSDAATQRRLLDIGRLLPHLRQLLSCVVCCRLLNDPYAPRVGQCQHNVCRLCICERKSLRPLCPACKDCQDFKMYEENRQMRCLLLCYKSLCEHLMNSTLFSQISKQRPPHPVTVNSTQPSIPLPHLSTQEFVLEGANYDEVLATFSLDLPRVSLLRPIAATTVPNSIAHMQANTQAAAKPVTPPNTNSGSGAIGGSHAGKSTPLIIPTVPKRERSAAGSALSLVAGTHGSGCSSAAATTTTTAAAAAAVPTVLPSQPQQQTLTIKHLRNIADLSAAAAVHLPMPASAAVANKAALVPGNATTFTYVSGNTPGIVVPIVSSSGTTTAPLTIASAKFRQLAQARQQAFNISNATAAAAPSIATATTAASTVAALNAAKPLLAEMQQQQAQARTSYKLAVPPTVMSVASTHQSQHQLHSVSSDHTTTTTATVTSQTQIRHPPPIKTVSNGSAMYSVLYTGIGNKITIKRKTDGDEDATQKKNVSTAAAAVSAAATTTMTTAALASAATTSQTNAFRQLAVKSNPKRRGCRCGNATATPGKLTCCGQRCPCYVESKSCIGCKCRGCRNPHRPDGGKVRPVIPELACYEIQMADESSSLSPNDLPIATASTTTAATAIDVMHQQQHQPPSTLDDYHHTTQTATVLSAAQQQQLNTSTATTAQATIIPLRSLHQLTATAATTQQQQHHLHQQQLQQQHQQQATTQAFASSHINSISSSNAASIQTAANTSTSNVLLQNAEGKYQVVPLHHFTAAAVHGHANQTVVSQIASMQRSQTMTTVNSTFILPNAAAVAAASCPTTSSAVSTQQLPQIIMHHQQQQHQQQTHSLQQRIVAAGGTSGVSNINTTTALTGALPLQQLQQQLKQNNIITVHPLPPPPSVSSSTSSSTTCGNNNIQNQQQLQQHHPQTIPLLNSNVSVAPNTTITLSPIIVNSSHAGNTFTADLFHHAHDTATGATVGDYLNMKSVRTATPNSNASNSSLSPQIITVPLAQASPLANVACMNVNNNANSISVSVNNITTTHN